jgi:hypothetical protein
MERQIDRVTVNDQPGILELSSRLGYNTIMPVALGCLILGVVWCVASLFIFPEEWLTPVIVGPSALTAIYVGLATLMNRTRLTVSALGLEWGTRPFRIRGYPFRRGIRAEQVACVFVSLRPVSGRYTRTYNPTYDLNVLSVDGLVERMLSRIAKLDSARELAALVENQLRLSPSRVIPPLSTASRHVGDDFDMPNRKNLAFFYPLLITLGLLSFASPWLRTAWKTETVARVTEVGWVTRQGSKRSYQQQVCYVDFDTPQGLVSVHFEENCPRSAKTGDMLTLFYNPEHPKQTVVRSIPKSLFGLVFFLPGLIGSIYLLLSGTRDPRIIEEDRFQFLNPYWDLRRNATAGHGVLLLTAEPGETLAPFLCEKAFSTALIDLQVRPRTGLSRTQAAGIKFWADGLGQSYVFAVAPVPAWVEVWRVRNNKWKAIMPAIPYARTEEGFIALRVVTQGTRADLFVNGVGITSLTGEPPPGGSMAGLCAIFPKDTNASWEFAEFRVTAT